MCNQARRSAQQKLSLSMESSSQYAERRAYRTQSYTNLDQVRLLVVNTHYDTYSNEGKNAGETQERLKKFFEICPAESNLFPHLKNKRAPMKRKKLRKFINCKPAVTHIVK
jgi:hypothetical protein